MSEAKEKRSSRRFSLSGLLGKSKDGQEATEKAREQERSRKRYSLAPSSSARTDSSLSSLPKSTSSTALDLRSISASGGEGNGPSPRAKAAPSPRRDSTVSESPRGLEMQLMSNPTPKSNPKYRRQLNTHFKLPPEHQLVDHFLCQMQYVNMNNGRLFVTTEEVCFFSRVQGYVIKKRIAYVNMIALEKKSSALIREDAIEITTNKKERFFFAGFEAQAAAFQTIESAFLQATSKGGKRGRTKSKLAAEELRKQERSSIRQNIEALNVADSQGNFIQKAMARVTKVESVKNLQQMLQMEEEEEEEEEELDPMLDSSASRELLLHFSVPRDERVFETCDCALKQGSFHRGRLYLSNRFICFRSLSGKSSIVQLAFELVHSIEEVTLANIYPIGIKIVTKANPPVSYVFGFFLDRARVFAAMQKAMSSFKEVDRTAAILKEDPKSIFQKVFVAKNLVAPTEGVLRAFKCVIEDPVARRGFLFLTPNFLCYYAVAYHVSCQEAIPFGSMMLVKKGKAEVAGSNSTKMVVYTSTAKYNFLYVEGIDEALKVVEESWQVMGSQKGLPDPPPPPKADFQRVKAGGYFFCLPKGSRKVSEVTDEGYTATFCSARNDKQLQLTVKPPWPAVCSLEDNELDFLRYEAERHLLSSLDVDETVTVLSSKRYVRSTIPMNDPCPWVCWQVRAKSTQKASLVVIYCRRKYLPPTGSVHQDVIFKFVGQQLKKRGTMPRLRRLELYVDTLAPKVVFTLDTGVLQYELDSLIHDHSAYDWCKKAHKMDPDTRELAIVFFKSFFHQLEKADIACISRMLFPTVQPEEPLQAIATMNNLTERQCENEEEWKARVSSYLGYAVEHFKKGFGWQAMVDLLRDDSCPRSVKETVEQAIQQLVHVRKGRNASSEALSVPLEESLTETELLEEFSVNERVVLRLLECGFFSYLFANAEEGSTTRFLVGLLRNCDSEDLMIGVCKSISALALADSSHKQLLISNKALAPLRALLLSTNGLLVHAAAKALVNITSSYEKAKQKLAQEGILPFIIRQFLNNRHCGEAVLRMMLLLLRNCVDTSERRAIVTMEGGVTAIVSLLRQRRDGDSPIMADIMSAIWNVTDDGNRGLVTVEGVIPLLSHVLKTTKNELILEKTLGAMLAVCAGSSQNKLKMVRQAVYPKLCAILSTSSNVRILRNALALLTSLCSEKENREALVMEKVTSVIICLANFGQPSVQPFAEELLQCL